MFYLVLKSALSGIIVMIVSETAKRSPALGGLIASLPLVSILGILWLWKDTGDVKRIAAHAESTFWFVLPSLPFFLILPTMLHYEIAFRIALFASCAITIALYLFMFWLLPKLGITI